MATMIADELPATTETLVLATGERMNRQEFHRLYEQTPEHFRAELIGGVVYVASPQRRNHGSTHVFLSMLFGLYVSETQGTEPGDNNSLLLGADSEPQPDLYLRVLPQFGGQSTTTPDDYVAGAPELVAEIALSSRSLDLHAKRADYGKHGVREYLVVVPRRSKIYWFDLESDAEHSPSNDGIIRCHEFSGLWLHVEAILNSDYQTALAVLRAGIATTEHQTFAAKLASHATRM